MYINIHTHHISPNPSLVLDVYNQYPWHLETIDTFYSIGIHPIYIDQSDIEKDIKTIRQHLLHPKCIAIGEIGLDKLCPIDFNLQIEIFKRQLLIAEEFQVPVIIHCVRAYQEVLQLKNELKLTIPFVFHGFNKNKNLAEQLLKNNCKLSFGRNLLGNVNLQTIFAEISAEYFFLENDASQLPIQEIYQKAAEIRNTSVDDIREITTRNFRTIFKNNIV